MSEKNCTPKGFNTNSKPTRVPGPTGNGQVAGKSSQAAPGNVKASFSTAVKNAFV
jgi:hypothetical protein